MKGEIQRASENVRRKAEEESKRVRKKEEQQKERERLWQQEIGR